MRNAGVIADSKKIRAKVEHVFRVIKCQFGYRKFRYRGIT